MVKEDGRDEPASPDHVALELGASLVPVDPGPPDDVAQHPDCSAGR